MAFEDMHPVSKRCCCCKVRHGFVSCLAPFLPWCVLWQVFFVDYGNSERVPFICLCVMSAVDQREPPQAVRCCLAGVKPVLTGWSDMSSTRFIDLVEDKHLMAHVCISTWLALFSLQFSLPPTLLTSVPVPKG